MNTQNDLDRLVTTWLGESAGAGAPDYLAETLDGIGRLPQRPAWRIPERWLPMQLTLRRATFPRALPVVALIALLVLALAAAAFIAGGRRTVPPPFGLAGTGLIATDADGKIVLVGADGTQRQSLSSGTNSAYGATWSLDGQRVAYWQEAPDGTAALFVVDADGSHARRLAPELSLLVDARYPAVTWSPDASQVAFSTFGGDLYVVAADGSAVRRINGAKQLSSPAFSPDGTMIAARSTGGIDHAVYVLAPDGTSVTRVSSRLKDDYDGLLPSWSPDGRLAYTSTSVEDGTHDIVVATHGPSGWTEQTVVGGDEWDSWPSWSNDGQSIAFVRSRDNLLEGDVFVVDVTGPAATPRQLGNDLVAWTPVCFAPDDAAVVALAGEPGVSLDQYADPHLLVMPAAGGPAASIPVPGIRGFASCSLQRLAR